jgi:hypothetical protein
MGNITEEDKKNAAWRKRPQMVLHAPCKDCMNRKRSIDGGKICEPKCEAWQEYLKNREEMAERRKNEKYKERCY